MVSGLSGTSSGHAHFFRDFTRMLRADILARGEDTSNTETGYDEADVETEAELPAEGSEEMVAELSSRDREVLAHEAAHMSAGGSHIHGGASYTYQTGPDGKQYAIGGEVSIDMSSVPGNPRATITKMMTIRAAALAPANPSAQDMAVASAAAQMEAQARAQLNQMQDRDAAPAMRTAAGRYAKPAAKVGKFVHAMA